MSDAARETLDVAHDVAKLLDTGLDREQLAVLIALVERGVNPEALAAVVRELRREAAALKSEEGGTVTRRRGREVCVSRDVRARVVIVVQSVSGILIFFKYSSRARREG